MMECTKILMNEHQVILAKLSLLEQHLNELTLANLLELKHYFEFIQSFADKFHHAKEEKIYFEWIAEHNPSMVHGPVACMLEEHEQGRLLVQNALKLSLKKNPSEQDIENIKNGLLDFILLLREHISKEDNVLYRMAEGVNREVKNGDEKMLGKFKEVEVQFSSELSHFYSK